MLKNIYIIHELSSQGIEFVQNVSRKWISTHSYIIIKKKKLYNFFFCYFTNATKTIKETSLITHTLHVQRGFIYLFIV